MTRDEIIELAREAGFRAGHIKLGNSDPLPFVVPCSAMDCLPELERFTELVVAAERETCAKVFDQMAEEAEADMEPSCRVAYYREKARTIRARGGA